MRSSFVSRLLCGLLACLSLSVNAASVQEPAKAPTAAVSAVESVTKVDLNAADAPTLQKELSGVGKAKSEAIVAYRDMNGKFTSIDELLEVDGIGKAILDRNRDKVTVN